MRLAALIFALAFAPLSLQAQWTIQTPTTADLRGIDNVGKGIAWASGTNGTVLRTEDAGYLWQRCTIPPNAEHLDFRGIQAFDANTAIVMSSGPGDQSRLYKTTDGCQTWTLLFTNPDKEGFWDAMRFEGNRSFRHEFPDTVMRHGILIGDPVDGNFVIYLTNDSGEHWQPWSPYTHTYPKLKRPPVTAVPGESLFAASNSAGIAIGTEIEFVFVTGGIRGSRIYWSEPFPINHQKTSQEFEHLDLPIASSESSGAFSVAPLWTADRKPLPDLMIVGGDYKKPEDAGTSLFIKSNSLLEPGFFQKPWFKPITPPHGYRSAVAYDSKTKTWITVGPNGTDISTDDGRNWRPLHPTNNEAPDADQHWNALSLPYAVGPHGRIGILNPSALQRK